MKPQTRVEHVPGTVSGMAERIQDVIRSLEKQGYELTHQVPEPGGSVLCTFRLRVGK